MDQSACPQVVAARLQLFTLQMPIWKFFLMVPLRLYKIIQWQAGETHSIVSNRDN